MGIRGGTDGCFNLAPLVFFLSFAGWSPGWEVVIIFYIYISIVVHRRHDFAREKLPLKLSIIGGLKRTKHIIPSLSRVSFNDASPKFFLQK